MPRTWTACARLWGAVALTLVTLVPRALAQGEQPRQLPGNKPCPFPPAAQKDAITGPVRFVAQVTPEGTVESVDIRRAPWPGVGFEDAVRGCVAQWRFEAATDGKTDLRSYAGAVRFRVATVEEIAIRVLLEDLAAAWNARDQNAIEDLEAKPGELPALSRLDEPFLSKTLEAGKGSDPGRLELETDLTSLRFLKPDLAYVRQGYLRLPTSPATHGEGKPAVLQLTAAKTPRGWRFVALSGGDSHSSSPPRVGQIREPRKLKDVKPKYPKKAKDARVQGIVTLECVISPEGKVTSVRVLRGIPLLDEAAMKAVKQWLYTPTLLNGKPVPVIMTVTVNFRLS